MAPRMEGIRHDFNRFYANVIGRQRIDSALNAMWFELHADEAARRQADEENPPR